MKKQLFTFFIVFCFFAPLYIASPVPASAQEGSMWSPQQRIPDYQNDTLPPVLIADRNRTVYAFSSQWLARNSGAPIRGIFFNQWTLDCGWTRLTSVLLSPLKNDARLLDVILDSNGMIDVIFWGGDNTGANIYFSSAPIPNAENAQAWSVPILVATNAQDPENGHIFIDDQNNLVVLFGGSLQGNGLYTTRSKDRGVTWSPPILLFNTVVNSNLISSLRIFKGDSGTIHAIWNESSPAGQGRGIFYANLQPGESQWSTPTKLADAQSGLGTMTPAVIEYQGSVFALFNLPPHITMRRSGDDGKTWDNPSILFPEFAGVNGSLSLVVDSSQTLHLFFGQRIPGAPDIHGLWHSTWENGFWSEPDPVVSGPLIVDQTGDAGFDPYDANAIVSQGNTMLVIWHTDYASKQNGVWYSYETLNTPELAVTLPPAQALSALPTALFPFNALTPDLTPVLTPTPIAANHSGDVVETNNSMSSGTIVIISSGFVVFLVLLVFGGSLLRKKGS